MTVCSSQNVFGVDYSSTAQIVSFIIHYIAQQSHIGKFSQFSLESCGLSESMTQKSVFRNLEHNTIFYILFRGAIGVRPARPRSYLDFAKYNLAAAAALCCRIVGVLLGFGACAAPMVPLLLSPFKVASL